MYDGQRGGRQEGGQNAERDHRARPPQQVGVEGVDPPQLSVTQRLEQDRQHRVRGALRALRIVRPAGRDEAIRVRAGCRRGHPVQVGHRGSESPAGPPQDPRGSQEARDVSPRYVWTWLVVFTSGISTGGTALPSDAPVFTKTTRSSGVIVSSS